MPALMQAQDEAGESAAEHADSTDTVVPEAASEARTPVESFQPEERAAEDAVIAADPEPAEPDQLQELNESFRSFRPESPAEDTADPDPAEMAELLPPDEAPDDPVTTLRARRAAESQAAMEPHIPEPISYWEVPQSVRETMPEFRISVLVFAEDPEDRFVLINGQRLGEKEPFMGGVTLDEIRRDGAVFTYRNYRFLVKG